ncbi:ABC-type transport auxiliary lipoprotein family protein [Parvularcula sp. LCG005]|uniref:ABC-type transport auxiliary lipoprotein family protein n=1 Tax=Parvularcula sp. LCG005 TaxID=3078805 RepID=UPI002943DE05|nr:ABC-type transport auxiliary lipoprotein family protein [Parvularcula sp. LCG005]WOI54129.1 ABC-type transport auxiliary lipoprotein family protein [Parvularcula sp. LCG005]
MTSTYLRVLPLALLLTGCVSLLPKAGDLPPRLALNAGEPATGELTPAINATLVVGDPDSASAYNTFLVAIARGPYEIQYIENAQWTDRVPVLVRRFIEQRFENRALFTAVGDRVDLPVSDFELQTDIRSFEIDETSDQPFARVTLGAKLIDRRKKVLGTKIFSERVPVRSAELGDRIDALNEAATATADDLIEWTERLTTTATSP